MTLHKPIYSVFIVISFVISLLSWGLSSPVGSSPDDDFHLTSIWCSSLDTNLCKMGDSNDTRIVQSELLNSSCFAYKSESPATCQAENKIFSDSTYVQTDRGNFLGLYPKVFYAIMHTFAGDDVISSTLLMRFFNICLFTTMAVLLYWIVSLQQRRALSIALLITLVPLGVFFIPSTNPSGWAYFGLLFGIFALVCFLKNPDGEKRFFLGMYYIFAVVIASGTRGDAAAFMALLTLISFFSFGDFKNWKSSILPFVGTLISVLFYLSTKQSQVVSKGLAAPTGEEVDSVARSFFSLFGYNFLQISELWAGIFGFLGIGWLDTRLPAITWVSALCVFCGVMFTLLRGLTLREYIGVGLVAIILFVLPMYVLQISSSHVGENIQSRYLFPLLAGGSALILLAPKTSTPLLGRVQTVVITITISLANSAALYTNLSRYIQGQSWGTYWNLDVAAEQGWWWEWGPSPMFVWGVGTCAFLIAFSLIYFQTNAKLFLDLSKS